MRAEPTRDYSSLFQTIVDTKDKVKVVDDSLRMVLMIHQSTYIYSISTIYFLVVQCGK